MICDICRKRNATIRVKKKVGDMQTDHYICVDCASRFGYGRNVNQYFSSEGVFSSNSNSQNQRCPGCGRTWNVIAEMGVVGCAECYQVFRKHLSESIEKLHGKVSYAGRVPIAASPKMQRETRIAQARAQLADAIAQENFERAAVLRDYIHELENAT